jgi:hypothetical protein
MRKSTKRRSLEALEESGEQPGSKRRSVDPQNKEKTENNEMINSRQMRKAEDVEEEEDVEDTED